MTSFEIDLTKPTWDQRALEQGVHDIASLYGLRGLQVRTAPGEGWSCRLNPNGSLTVTIDPLQSQYGYRGVEGAGDADEVDTDQSTLPHEVTALFITGHEIGHACDMLDPDFQRTSVGATRSRHFFNMLVDDTVIDRRQRNIPRLDAVADIVYKHSMPSDLTRQPKHVQLMAALRATTVMSHPQLTMDKSVAEIVELLHNYQKGDQTYDVMEVLADPGTSLSDRRQVAQDIILPYYERFLQEDKDEATKRQEGQHQSGSGKDGDGEDSVVGKENGSDQDQGGDREPSFDSDYDEYERQTHGHRIRGGSDTPENSGRGDTPNDQIDLDDHDDLTERLAELMREMEETDATEEPDKSVDGEVPADLAGRIAAELHLRQDLAEEYTASLHTLRDVINQVAKVLLKLAAPADIPTRPTWGRRARMEGDRLHDGRMAEVAIQIATGQDMAIYQRTTREAIRQAPVLGGLDIYLQVDVSHSMARDDKAKCAADTALCLIEGLQLARRYAAKQAGSSKLPDVRIQITAFGKGYVDISPLSYEPTPEQKGRVYALLIAADNEATRVGGALEKAAESALKNPERQSIVIIVSDGSFGDRVRAQNVVDRKPHSMHIAQLVIGEGSVDYITSDAQHVVNPVDLPSRLLMTLRRIVRKMAGGG